MPFHPPAWKAKKPHGPLLDIIFFFVKDLGRRLKVEAKSTEKGNQKHWCRPTLHEARRLSGQRRKS